MQVFVVGLSVPPEREVDEYENECRHFLAWYEGAPAGTGRWRRTAGNKAKIERMAVLEDMRGRKIGAALMRAMMEDIENTSGVECIILGAQDHAIPFYESFGFEICGEGYDEVGIPHHDMAKAVGTCGG